MSDTGEVELIEDVRMRKRVMEIVIQCHVFADGSMEVCHTLPKIPKKYRERFAALVHSVAYWVKDGDEADA